MDGHSVLASIDAAVETNQDEDGDMTLGEVLAARQEDPGAVAGRQLDWEGFMSHLTDRQQEVVMGMAVGLSGVEVAQRLQVSAPRVTEIKTDVARKATGFWGERVLKDASVRPLWWRTRYQ